jgi:uncharacterized protein (TIGR02284 family)
LSPAPLEYFAIVDILKLVIKKRAETFVPSKFSRYDFYPHCGKAIMEKLVSVLNDLIRINHDRVVGYEKAIDELKDTDADLKTLFQRYILESREFAQELTHEVTRLGGNAADGTTNSGKIYRVWMDLKAAITGKERKAILDNCEFGEDAAQKAYDLALNSDVELEPALRDLVVRQKAVLKAGHDEVKRLRDMQAATQS